MYKYEGTGYCLPLDEGELDDFIDVYNDITGDGVDDEFGIDDAMSVGDWCSIDNIDYATLDGEPLDVGAGLFVLRDGTGDEGLFETICENLDIDAGKYHGEFVVSCWE